MLVVSSCSRPAAQTKLLADLRRAEVPLRLLLHRGSVELESVSWRDYWHSCKPFFSADARLVQRLNRLKAAWLEILRKPGSRRRQLTYCWRYFGLLHHTLGIAVREPGRGNPLPVLHRILSFGSFMAAADGDDERAACAFSAIHPVYLLGRMASGGRPGFARAGVRRTPTGPLWSRP